MPYSLHEMSKEVDWMGQKARNNLAIVPAVFKIDDYQVDQLRNPNP